MSEARPPLSHFADSEGPLTLAIVDQSHTAKEHARDYADTRLTAELNQGPRLEIDTTSRNIAKRIVKSIWQNRETLTDSQFWKARAQSVWKGNIARDRYERIYKNEAERDIVASQDILAYEADDNGSERSRLATLRRFQSEYAEAIHGAAGEQRQELRTDSEVALALKNIIRRYVVNELDDETLREEKTRIIAAFREAHGDELLGQGLVSIDNTLDIARAVKGAVEHGESLDRVLDGMKMVSGEARSGVRTETKLKYNSVDKLIDKVNGSKIGSLVQPEIIVGAATTAASILRFGSRSTAKKAVVLGASAGTVALAAPAVLTVAAATGATAIFAGLWAGARESRRFKDERVQHMREMAQGKEYSPQATRRLEMEAARYQTASAKDLVASLESHLEPDTLDTTDALQVALDQLSAIETRVKLSDSRNIDLITYSAPDAVEEERWALDLARARAKTALRHRLDPDVRHSLGLDDVSTLDEILAERAEMFIGYTENDITTKDDEFSRMRKRAMRSAAVKGAVLGAAFGALAQEGLAAASDSRTGLIEQVWHAHNVPFDGERHQTLLYGLAHGDHASRTVMTPYSHDAGSGTHSVLTHYDTHVNTTTAHYEASSTFEGYELGDHSSVLLSDEHALQINTDGTISIIDPAGHATIDHLPVNPDGTLPPDSIAILHDHGMIVEHIANKVDGEPKVALKTVSLDEYMANHQDSTLHVQRDLYYFNDTPPDCEGPNSDLNELGLGWGGDGGTGVAQDGSIQMSVATMTPSGSFEYGMSVNWQEAASTGHLQLLITPSADMQANPIVVPINPDGTIDIVPGSPAAQFFTIEDGHAVINASFVEVAQTTDVDANDVTHVNILATAVGNGDVSELQDTTSVPSIETFHDYKITTAGYDTTTSVTESVPVFEDVPNTEIISGSVSTTVIDPVFTELPPVLPIISRAPLETARSIRQAEGVAYYNGDTYLSAAERLAREEETSPRLLDNPHAQLNPHEELTWYKGLVRKKRGKKYVREITSAIDASPELSKIPPETKSIITIPVNAAGVAESKTIYSLLKAYANQDHESLEHTTILLHVNWSDAAGIDAEKKNRIERTKSEISRAKADFPHLKIATIETEWDSEKYKDGVIGYIGRKMNDAAMFALESAMSKGHMSSDQQVLIIRNDADAKGVHRRYLKHFMQDAERYKETDVFTGTTSFDNTKARSLPGMVLASNFERSLNLIETSRGNLVHTAGANFGVRASVLAAVGSSGFDEWNGAGSDDVGLGRRIQGARGGSYRPYALRQGYNRTSVRSRARRNSYAYTPTPPADGSKRRIARRVAGARIDTDSDREEALYRNGRPMVLTWNDGAFDKGGYAERESNLHDAAHISDDPRTHPDEVIERVRADMEGSINFSRISEATARSALTFMFYGLKPNTSAGYILHSTDGIDGRTYHLEFTELGKKHVLNHLERDSKGRFDRYGNRKMRQLYGEAMPTERRAPRNPAPLLRVQ